MALVDDSFDYHKTFHQILGRVTTIRSACSVILEDYTDQLPQQVTDMIRTMNEHSVDLVKELQELREQVYQIIDKDK